MIKAAKLMIAELPELFFLLMLVVWETGVWTPSFIGFILKIVT